jgi:glycosyltransferase involved in cell wall biosynthesis
LKIALVVPGGVDRSGVDRVVPALLWQVERLARRHAVHVFALSQEPAPGHWELLGAKIHNVGTDGGSRRRFAAWFAAEHKRAPFDVIHAFWAGAGVRALRSSIRWRVPMLVHAAGGEFVALRDIEYGNRCTWKGRLALRATLAAARSVTVASGYMQRLGRDCGFDSDIIPLGVALDRWPPLAPRNRDRSRPARLLHIADIRPVKNPALLLRAAALLRDSDVSFVLDVAGHDTMHGEMRNLAVHTGLESYVRWHGVLGRDALRALTETADMLVVTSRHDAGPLAVLEAAIAGVPTVGTAVGHVADWAPDAAVSVPDGDAAALASGVMGLLRDEPRRMEIAREAQRRATAIDADHTTGRFEQLYADIAAPHAPRIQARARIATQ